MAWIGSDRRMDRSLSEGKYRSPYNANDILPQACNIGKGCSGAAVFLAVATELKVFNTLIKVLKVLEVQRMIQRGRV